MRTGLRKRRSVIGAALMALGGVVGFGSGLARAETATSQSMVTVVVMPTVDVTPADQDFILAALARQLRSQYGIRAVSGRAVGRAVWGGLDTALPALTKRFIAKVAEGRRAYQQLKIDEVLRAMGQAQRWLATCGPEIRDEKVFVDLHLYAGLALLAKNEPTGAAAAFQRAVALNQKTNLSARKFPPDVVRAFETAKQELLARQAGEVSFVSRPAGAVVFVDGVRRGRTPLRGLRLFPGSHYIRLELSGHSLWTLTLPEFKEATQIKALMVPRVRQAPPKELLASAIANESLSATALRSLRKLARALHAEAVVLASLSWRDKNLHLGVRLYRRQPELIGRARVFNLGSVDEQYADKVAGVVRTLADLRAPGVKLAAGPSAPKQTRPLPVASVGNSTAYVNDQAVWYQSWWFWTAVGVVAAGAATGATLWLIRPEERWTLVVQP